MEWFILSYLLNEAEKKDIELSSLNAEYMPSLNYTPTKLDKWFKKHPIINTVWPYIAGVIVGLLPFIISVIMWRMADISISDIMF